MTYEKPKKFMGAASIIIDESGRVLLVKSRSYGRLNWELPGGWSELSESIMETAIREVKEETGLDICVERLTGIYYDPDFDMHHFAFIGTPQDGSLPRPDLEEITECAYWSLDELPRPISDLTITRIMDAVAIAKADIPLPRVIGPRKWLE